MRKHVKLRCNFSDTSSSFRPPICFVFKTEKIRRGTASIRDCKQTLQSDGIVLPIELLFTILISLECKPAKTKVRDQQRLEEFGTGPNIRAVALFSEELFLVQVSFSIARFPNCHECPEVSGLGNLTKKLQNWQTMASLTKAMCNSRSEILRKTRIKTVLYVGWHPRALPLYRRSLPMSSQNT